MISHEWIKRDSSERVKDVHAKGMKILGLPVVNENMIFRLSHRVDCQKHLLIRL